MARGEFLGVTLVIADCEYGLDHQLYLDKAIREMKNYDKVNSYASECFLCKQVILVRRSPISAILTTQSALPH